MKIVASGALIVAILGFAIYMSGGMSEFIANIASSRTGNSEEIIKLDELPARTQIANIGTTALMSAPKTQRKKNVASSTKITGLIKGTISSFSLPSTLHVLISEVMAGTKGNANYDFIELYNNSDMPTLLTGFSVKKKSSSGSESTLVAESRLSGKIISPRGYLLLANEGGYAGSVSSDVVWPASYSLASAKNGITVYRSGKIIDNVDWSLIPLGQSLVRDGWDNASFHINTIPTPQNTNYRQ